MNASSASTSCLLRRNLSVRAPSRLKCCAVDAVSRHRGARQRPSRVTIQGLLHRQQIAPSIVRRTQSSAATRPFQWTTWRGISSQAQADIQAGQVAPVYVQTVLATDQQRDSLCADIVSQLKSCTNMEFGIPETPCLVILVTPSLVKKINKAASVAEITKKLFMSSSSERAPTRNVTVYLAVIDGLVIPKVPLERSWGPSDLSNNCIDGVACVVCDVRVDDKQEIAEQPVPPSITFSFTWPAFGDNPPNNSAPFDPEDLQISIPLANTLFTNGAEYTIAQWDCRVAGKEPTATKSTLKAPARHLLLSIPRPANGKSPYTVFEGTLPLLPLTPPRRIESVMGNVLSTIRQDRTGSLTVAASSELEVAVDTQLRKMGQGPRKISIWALLYPRDLLAGPSEGEGQIAEQADLEWPARSEHQTFAWETIRRGGRLHEVVSGGGGWGLKSGLLSLAPRRLDASLDHKFGDKDSGTIAEEMAIKQVAKTGEMVQFFASADNTTDDLIVGASGGCSASTVQAATCQFGTIPMSEPRPASPNDRIVAFPDKLSVLSCSGLDISPPGEEKGTSIDVPFASVIVK